MHSLILRITLLSVTSLILPARAAAIEFSVPAWAARKNAQHSEWRTFSTAYGDPGNNPDVADSNAGAILKQTVPGAIVTGSGNIYNPGGASAFVLMDEARSPYEQVVLQAKTMGELAPESVVLEYASNGTMETLITDGIELGRQPGGFGDTIVTQWTWDLSDRDVSSITIQFAATAPHLSLVGVRLDALLEVETIDAFFNAPSQDRWNYPYNATPGKRSSASVFRSEEENVGIFRQGAFAIAFDTGDSVAFGFPSSAYEIVSAKLQVMTTSEFETPYDPTYDLAATHLPQADAAHLPDQDSGRPIELFGAGFRNGANLLTWEETAPYAPGPQSPPSVYPAMLNEVGEPIDVSFAINYAAPTDLPPMAIGTLESTAPGELIPPNTWMDFELDLANRKTVEYLRNGLSAGRLAFTVTSLNSGGQGVRTFPEFHTRDSLLGEAPRLEIKVRVTDTEPRTAPVITHGSVSNGEIALKFSMPANGAVGVRSTTDFRDWTEVLNPVFTIRADGSAEWTDSLEGQSMKFYQLYLKE